MRGLTPELRTLLDTPTGSARRLWRAGDWHRLTPVLQAWAHHSVSASYGFSSDDIDDIVSHTIVRAWTSAVVPDNPRAWIATVVANRAKDVRRRLKRRVDDAESIELAEAAERADDRVESVEQRRRLRRLRDAMQLMQRDERRVVYLHYIKQHSHAAISEMLGITEGASKMRAVRGVRTLAKLYEVTPLPELLDDGSPARPRGRPVKPMRWRELPHFTGTSARIDEGVAFAALRLLGAP